MVVVRALPKRVGTEGLVRTGDCREPDENCQKRGRGAGCILGNNHGTRFVVFVAVAKRRAQEEDQGVWVVQMRMKRDLKYGAN